MSDLEEDLYYGSILGGNIEPEQINDERYWIGTDKAVVNRTVELKTDEDYKRMSRGYGWPRDDIDYDPRIDNVEEKE